MDYTMLFRPIFAYAAHVEAAAKQPGWLLDHAPLVRRDLALLRDTAMQTRRAPLDPNFDQAWFALDTWLHAAFARLPDGAELARHFVPDAENREDDFHRRLTLLLTPLPGGYPNEILEIIRVYALCLDLGRHGRAPFPGQTPAADALRQRCHAAIQSGRPPPPPRRPAARPFRRCAAVAAVWLFPPLLPLVLYGVYRYFLDALYANVVG